MKTTFPTPDAHQEVREALRALRRGRDCASWERVDHERGCPAKFVTPLTGLDIAEQNLIGREAASCERQPHPNAAADRGGRR